MQARYIEFPSKGVVAVKTEEVSTEGIGALEVVVQNEATLVSAGTELSRYTGVEQGPHGVFPARPGYCAIGRIAAKGAGVTDYETGARVFYAGKHASAQRFLHGQNHQWGRLYPVPEGVKPEDGVFAALAEISMTAPCVTEFDWNDTVAVFGLGLIGNLAAQLYQVRARVIALDPVAQRCAIARACGIETVVQVPAEKQVEVVMELTGGKGAAVTVDAVGHSAVIGNCVKAAGLFGQVILLGTPRVAVPGDLTEVFHAVHSNGIVMRGAHMWRFPADEVRGAKQTVAWGYRTMFELMQAGKLKVAALRSHLAKPEEAQRMYEGLLNEREAYWGVVFDWRE